MQGVSVIQNNSNINHVAYSKAKGAKKEIATCEECTQKPDSYESSSTEKANKSNGIEGFNIDEFRKAIREELLQMIHEAKKNQKSDPSNANENISTDVVSDIPYAVSADEVAADVPEEWNAENTSQRIIDFALSFRSKEADLSDEEYIDQVRKAIQDGFRLAKNDLQNLPGPSAKLFNDTYELAMKKLDDTLANWQANPGSSVAQKSTQGTESSTKSVASTYSAVA